MTRGQEPGAWGSFVRLEPVGHRSLSLARQIHGVQRSAYAQEAALLGAVDFPPLRRTVEDILTCQEEFFAAFAAMELVGAISVWPDPEALGKNIASLVVSPSFQRRGIARALLAEVLHLYGGGILTVQTGARNEPALRLYSNAGFVEFRRWAVGEEPLELVKLKRLPAPAPWSGERATGTK